MSEPIYFPIARAKAGEIDAIGRIAPTKQGLVRPLLDFPRQKKKDKRPLARYLGEKVQEISSSWGTQYEICLDFSRYEPDSTVPDGRHIADYVFDIARQSRLKAIPVLAPLSVRGPGLQYFEAVSRIIRRDMLGAALRIPYEYFAKVGSLERVLGETISLASISPQHVDVYLDAYSLALVPSDSNSESALVEAVRLAALTVHALGYRKVVLAASNIPDSNTRHKKGEVLKVPRTEFRVWRRVVTDPLFSFLRFGDYGVVYPGQVESDAPAIPPSRVRLANDDEYLFYKGSREGIRRTALAVVTDGLLAGRSRSWGENAVRECAAGYGDPGGPAQWVSRDTNMHIENTVAALIRHSGKQVVDAEIVEAEQGPWLQESIGFSSEE